MTGKVRVMSPISQNYPSPVTVNGFSCRNCTDVDNAKRNIDPANPKAGPFGMNDPEAVKARQSLIAQRMAKIAEDLANPPAYRPRGAAAPDAIGSTIDRFG
jgi:hypothetical protein